MKISIIIPVHNGAETIEKCVESFFSQNCSNFEIVLVENHSTDNSLEICEKLESKYENVVCIESKQTGVCAARNEGLKKARGDIIGFADCDDTVAQGIVETIYHAFQKHPCCNMIATGLNKIYPDGKIDVKSLPQKKILSYKKMRRRVLYDSRVSGYVCNKFWKKEALDGVWFRTDLSHGEDAHFVMNSLTKFPLGKALILDSPLYNYYQTSTGATASSDKMFDSKNRLKLIVAAQAIIDDFKLDKITYIFVRRLMFSMASSQFLRFRTEGEKRKLLIDNMKKNLLFYIITIFASPMETIKRLIRLSIFG